MGRMVNDDLREPVGDYGAARRWLWSHAAVEDWFQGFPDDLPPVAALVCDMFWIERGQLLDDLRRDWRDICGGDSSPRRRRGGLPCRWR